MQPTWLLVRAVYGTPRQAQHRPGAQPRAAGTRPGLGETAAGDEEGTDPLPGTQQVPGEQEQFRPTLVGQEPGRHLLFTASSVGLDSRQPPAPQVPGDPI